MSVHVLPEQDKRHRLQFYCAPSLGYGTRLGIAAVLLAIGLGLQLILLANYSILAFGLSLFVLLVGNSFLLVRGYDTAPSELKSRGKWEKTTRDRFIEVVQLEKQTRKWDENLFDITCYSGFLTAVVAGGVVAYTFFNLEVDSATQILAIFFVGDAAVLLLPHWFSGTRRGWKPVSLGEQVRSLLGALEVIDSMKQPPCQVQCLFELVKSGEEEEIRTPSAARVFIRFPEGPEDFLGLQFQVSLNNVQGTQYPYLYVVFVAKKSFGLHKRFLKKIDNTAGFNWVVSKSSEVDVDVIVLRQKTTKTSGYHTKPAAIREIAKLAWTCASIIVSKKA